MLLDKFDISLFSFSFYFSLSAHKQIISDFFWWSSWVELTLGVWTNKTFLECPSAFLSRDTSSFILLWTKHISANVLAHLCKRDLAYWMKTCLETFFYVYRSRLKQWVHEQVKAASASLLWHWRSESLSLLSRIKPNITSIQEHGIIFILTHCKVQLFKKNFLLKIQ